MAGAPEGGLESIEVVIVACMDGVEQRRLWRGNWSGHREKESYSLVGKGSELSFGLYTRSSGTEANDA